MKCKKVGAFEPCTLSLASYAKDGGDESIMHNHLSQSYKYPPSTTRTNAQKCTRGRNIRHCCKPAAAMQACSYVASLTKARKS